MADKTVLWRALKKLRQPLLEDLEGLWLPYVANASSMQNPNLEHIDGLKAAVIGHDHGQPIEYVAGIRETVLAKVSKLYGKAAEAFSAARKLESSSCWLSAVAAQYDACFYMAKAISHVLGFAQMGRDSPFLIDIFPTPASRKEKALADAANSVLVHRVGRWDHMVVWNLLSRLTDTAKGNQTSKLKLVSAVDQDRISDRRNAYLYESSFFGLEVEIPHIDIPEDNFYALADQGRTISAEEDYDQACYYHALYIRLNDLFEFLVDTAGIASVAKSHASQARISAMAA